MRSRASIRKRRVTVAVLALVCFISATGKVRAAPQSQLPVPPRLTETDIEQIRLRYVVKAGSDALARYKAASSDGEKNAIFDEAMTHAMLAQTNEETHYRGSRRQESLKHFTPETSYLHVAKAALKDPKIRGHAIVEEFFQAHGTKVDNLLPLAAAELQLRIEAAFLYTTSGLGTPAWLALSDSSELRSQAASIFFPDTPAMNRFFESHTDSVSKVQGFRDVMLDFILHQITPQAREEWGQDGIMHKLVGEVPYQQAVQPQWASHGRGVVLGIFGPQGVRLFDAGSDGEGPPPVSSDEQLANKNRLLVASEMLDSFSVAVGMTLDTAPVNSR